MNYIVSATEQDIRINVINSFSIISNRSKEFQHKIIGIKNIHKVSILTVNCLIEINN